MTLGEIRGKTLSELRRARKNMTSAEWLTAVEDLPKAGRTAAATALLDTCLAIRRLENTRVADIRQQLAANEKELERGIGGLKRAGEKLRTVRVYLKAAAALAATVGKVVKPL